MNHSITEQTQNQLKIITEKIPGLLEDYKKYFIFFHKNPEVVEYQQIYVQQKTELQNTNKDLVKLGEQTELSIAKLHKMMEQENTTLNDKKSQYQELIKGFEYYQSTLLGTEQMTDDFNTLYNIQYYKNVQMLFGIGIVGALITFLMKKK